MPEVRLQESEGEGMRACYGCQKRTATCHGNCKEYADERAELAEQREARMAAGKANRDYRSYWHDRKTAIIRTERAAKRK